MPGSQPSNDSLRGDADAGVIDADGKAVEPAEPLPLAPWHKQLTLRGFLVAVGLGAVFCIIT